MCIPSTSPNILRRSEVFQLRVCVMSVPNGVLARKREPAKGSNENRRSEVKFVTCYTYRYLAHDWTIVNAVSVPQAQRLSTHLQRQHCERLSATRNVPASLDHTYKQSCGHLFEKGLRLPPTTPALVFSAPCLSTTTPSWPTGSERLTRSSTAWIAVAVDVEHFRLETQAACRGRLN